jgi:tRNA pseudouridine38-40 synthase
MEQKTFKLTVSYDGTAYSGWQVQLNGMTIQQALETALARILGERIRVTGSGRTDAGVHALGQVASFSAATEIPAERLARAINGNLPDDIRVLDLVEAPGNFHAIRDARWKIYRYFVEDCPLPNVFRRAYCWHVRTRLDANQMTCGAKYLIGRHNFVSFQAANSPRASTVRTIFRIRVERIGTDADQIQIEVGADGFLYNMVRNIVGTLVSVGRGDHPPEWVGELRAAHDRKRAPATAPPQGLFLMEVGFNDLPPLEGVG